MQQGSEAIVSSKRIAAIALLVLMDMALSFIEAPVIPGADWLKLDASCSIAVFAGMLYGPATGSLVAVCGWVPRLASDPVGAFMNVAAALALVLVVSGFHKPGQPRLRALAAAALAIVAATAVSICLNFVVTPLHLGLAYEDVLALVLPVLLPFNLLKDAVNLGLAYVFAWRFRAFRKEGPEDTGRAEA